ncbi:MAG: hypothetical protein HN919_12085 [Verrucomicrobia bacterium]|jgi:hypothetical protein|nr:hypothetical protein [Verrucomicrobiota bacterium]MBT7067037.1 hypothetical protein [Verrucomicrobiota bacterium]MBT7699073.1 hypothetical protein [Verrucomicrobiota bacterium]
MRTSTRLLLLTLTTLALYGCGPSDDETALLREQNAALTARMERMEQGMKALTLSIKAAPPAAPTSARPVSPPDAGDLLAQIEKLIDARVEALLADQVGVIVQDTIAHTVGTPADIEVVVGEVVEEELAAADKRREEARTLEREKRREEWAQRRRDRDAERLEELATELSLNDWQKQSVSEVETATRDQIRAKMTEMREAGNFDMQAFRDVATSLRETNNTAVAEILTADQLTTYKERQESEFGFMFRGGRGR